MSRGFQSSAQTVVRSNGSRYRSDEQLLRFTSLPKLFGPIIKARLKHFEPFGQILFGVAHANAYANLSKVIAATSGATLSVQGNQNPFTMAVGGGIDIPVGKVIAIRPAEVDYLLTRLTNPLTLTNNQNNFRYSAGIQFRFGGR